MRQTEISQLVIGAVPADMASAALTGDWVSMKGYGKIRVCFAKGAGTTGDDPTLTIQQATAVAGTSAKALNFTTLYTKTGTQTSTGTFTKVTQTAANTYTDTTAAEKQALWVVEFNAEDLDVDNGFDCVQAAVADTGTTTNPQYGVIWYELLDPRYPQATPQSAIVD